MSPPPFFIFFRMDIGLRICGVLVLLTVWLPTLLEAASIVKRVSRSVDSSSGSLFSFVFAVWLFVCVWPIAFFAIWLYIIRRWAIGLIYISMITVV